MYNKWFPYLIIALTFLILMVTVKGCHAEDVNLDVIADIESSGNPLAYNKESGAAGEYQITEGVVVDYNHRTDYMPNVMPSAQYELKDMYLEDCARYVADFYINYKIPQYLKAYGMPDTITSRIIAWNWGVGRLHKWFKKGSHWNKLPLETRNYILKYNKEINQ